MFILFLWEKNAKIRVSSASSTLSKTIGFTTAPSCSNIAVNCFLNGNLSQKTISVPKYRFFWKFCIFYVPKQVLACWEKAPFFSRIAEQNELQNIFPKLNLRDFFVWRIDEHKRLFLLNVNNKDA